MKLGKLRTQKALALRDLSRGLGFNTRSIRREYKVHFCPCYLSFPEKLKLSAGKRRFSDTGPGLLGWGGGCQTAEPGPAPRPLSFISPRGGSAAAMEKPSRRPLGQAQPNTLTEAIPRLITLGRRGGREGREKESEAAAPEVTAGWGPPFRGACPHRAGL